MGLLLLALGSESLVFYSVFTMYLKSKYFKLHPDVSDCLIINL